MAKAKVATRKKGSKRRNANAKVKRKSAARRATAKKVKLRAATADSGNAFVTRWPRKGRISLSFMQRRDEAEAVARELT
jgi:murein DD-endopeptidase MepM/ murein hydrolase activator NlpD